jgi:uncharacterized protein (DUF1684 family)
MKLKNVILLIAVVLVIVIVFYGFQGSKNDPAYLKTINDEREEKDRFMCSGADSPFTKDSIAFRGLDYLDPDLSYRIVADLIPITNKKVVVLATSDGKEQRYIEYANATFDMNGVSCKLLILEVMDMGPARGKLFLAFGDATSGKETYGAGRYLDVSKVPGSTTITLDFNKAYNPYCAYSDTYSCQFPPAENLLEIAIRAGEKSYH